jgi:hypothetical protein
MGSVTGCTEYCNLPCLSEHVGSRMGSRRISPDDVANVMSYGRTYHVRGAVIYAIGRHEAELYRKEMACALIVLKDCRWCVLHKTILLSLCIGIDISGRKAKIQSTTKVQQSIISIKKSHLQIL